MASNKYTVVDIQNDDQEIDLKFQDFGETPTRPSNSNANEEQTIFFSEFPDSAIDDSEQRLLEEDGESAQKATHSFWSFEYYKQYFDVESKQVADRILWSAFPKPGVNYLQSYIRPNPDLYGPFWVCITLVLTTAISGNIAEYLLMPQTYHWKYDFHKVTLAASVICSYAWLVPIIIWGALLWRGSKASLKLLELVCIYGYSLSVFVPVSIFWTIPLPWLQWCIGIVATVLSGMVLIRTILPAVSHEAKKIAIATSIVILVLHAALALGFMLYFFYSPPLQSSEVASNVSTGPFHNETDNVQAEPSKQTDGPKHARSNKDNNDTMKLDSNSKLPPDPPDVPDSPLKDAELPENPEINTNKNISDATKIQKEANKNIKKDLILPNQIEPDKKIVMEAAKEILSSRAE